MREKVSDNYFFFIFLVRSKTIIAFISVSYMIPYKHLNSKIFYSESTLTSVGECKECKIIKFTDIKVLKKNLFILCKPCISVRDPCDRNI